MRVAAVRRRSCAVKFGLPHDNATGEASDTQYAFRTYRWRPTGASGEANAEQRQRRRLWDDTTLLLNLHELDVHKRFGT